MIAAGSASRDRCLVCVSPRFTSVNLFPHIPTGIVRYSPVVMTTTPLPIGILDEHPQWSTRLMQELERLGLPYERMDHASNGYDPAERRARYSVVINRSSPSSHRRGHGGVLFYTEALLAHIESLGVPV